LIADQALSSYLLLRCTPKNFVSSMLLPRSVRLKIVLTNGTRVVVDHPQFMSFSRDYRTAHVYDVDGSGKRVDVKRIIALNELKNGSRPRKRKQ